jgi:glycosyltransferase involved in cell wall biosynthesis
VAVVPSIYAETFGLVIPEYYQHGIMVIGSRAGAIPELIEDGYNGFLFPPGDVEALTSLLHMLSSDSTLLSEMSKNAWASARTFDLNVHVQKLEEIYKEVASG